MHIERIQKCLKDLRALREEVLDDYNRRREFLVSESEHVSLRQGLDSGFKETRLANLQNSILAIDTETKNEETSFGDWKRTKAREWMRVLFSGLLECNEKGTVVATLTHAIIDNLSNKVEQPSNKNSTGGIQSQPPPHLVPPKVSLKRDTAMGDQSVPTRSQDQRLAKPVPRYVGLVGYCCVRSSLSALTSTPSIVGTFVLRFLLITPRPKAPCQRHLSGDPSFP